MADIKTVYTELETAISLEKCRKCGCMQTTLDNLSKTPGTNGEDGVSSLAESLPVWAGQMQPIRYSCRGCEHCYPAVAQNEFVALFPAVAEQLTLDCDFQVNTGPWPPVVGEYFVLDTLAPVAVSTLANAELAEVLAQQKTAGLAIVGKTETENIGIDKIVKNVISNPAIQFLVVAGQESKGHQTGQTLLMLAKNGVDTQQRIIGSPGKGPFLRNVSAADVDTFRQQVQVINMIGCQDVAKINTVVAELAQQADDGCDCGSCDCDTPAVPVSNVDTVYATEPDTAVKLDKAGYFVIVPLPEKNIINVEHYAYNNTLLRVIEGSTARELYKTIITNGWVSELSHAAYLGRELAKAELANEYNFKYIQDGA